MLDVNNSVATSVDHRYHDMSNWIETSKKIQKESIFQTVFYLNTKRVDCKCNFDGRVTWERVSQIEYSDVTCDQALFYFRVVRNVELAKRKIESDPIPLRNSFRPLFLID